MPAPRAADASKRLFLSLPRPTIAGNASETHAVTLTPEETAEIQSRLRNLQMEHRDLDEVIARLTVNPPNDQLLIRRLKKRKLYLKDRITQLEGMLVPDIPA